MNEEFFRNTFFPLIRAGLRLSNEGVAFDKTDYSKLVGTAKDQAVLPIVTEGLRNLEIADNDPEFAQELCDICDTDIALFLHRDIALENIKKCFEKHEIDYVFLKGSELKDLYPEPWMRTSCDIDVLVREEDVDEAVSALKKETDFEYQNRSFHDVFLTSENVNLELHFNINENMESIDKLLSKAWENTVKCGESHQFCFTAEYRIFHIIAHMFYHFAHGGLGIRPYIDLWLLRHKTEFDDNAVRTMCDQCGILKFYEKSCELSEVWLEKSEHDNVTRQLEQYCLNGGVFGSKKNRVLAIKRKHKGIRYFFSRMFVSKKSLQITYPGLKKHPNLIFLYQIRRWIDAIIHSRSKIKNEITILKNSNDEEVESISQLFDYFGV